MDDEKTIWNGRSSFWNWWFELVIGDLLILLAIALWWIDYGHFAPWAAGSSAFLYLAVAFKRYGNRFKVTNHRVVAKEGIFSRSSSEIEIRDIRNITLDQSLLQRMVRTGDLGISSAGGDGVEVLFKGIPDAKSVKEKIRKARLEIHRPLAGKNGG